MAKFITIMCLVILALIGIQNCAHGQQILTSKTTIRVFENSTDTVECQLVIVEYIPKLISIESINYKSTKIQFDITDFKVGQVKYKGKVYERLLLRGITERKPISVVIYADLPLDYTEAKEIISAARNWRFMWIDTPEEVSILIDPVYYKASNGSK